MRDGVIAAPGSSLSGFVLLTLVVGVVFVADLELADLEAAGLEAPFDAGSFVAVTLLFFLSATAMSMSIG
jgi:hypothetical protein